MRKQSPVWKYSFCQLQPRLGDILACQVFRVYGRIVRILLSIRTVLNAYLASQNLCFWIQECRLRPCCISSANQNYDALMALVLIFLLDRSWMLPLTSVASRASGVCAPSEGMVILLIHVLLLLIWFDQRLSRLGGILSGLVADGS